MMHENCGGGAVTDLRLPTADCQLKVRRVRDRLYDGTLVMRDAEYALVMNGQTVAHIIVGSMRRRWVVVEGHTETRFGLVVSPLNLRLIRDLRKWAIERWGNADS